MKFRLSIIILILGFYLHMEARTASDFFVNAPDNVVRLLPQSTRLDMVDYYDFGSKRSSENLFGGNAKITSKSDAAITLDIDSGVEMQIAVLPAKNDTLIAVVTTLKLPVEDSSIEFYKSDWSSVKNPPFTLPLPKKWVNSSRRSDFEGLSDIIPFIPVKAVFNDTATTLTLSNQSSKYLSRDDFEAVAPLLVEEMVFDTDRFTLIK